MYDLLYSFILYVLLGNIFQVLATRLQSSLSAYEKVYSCNFNMSLSIVHIIKEWAPATKLLLHLSKNLQQYHREKFQYVIMIDYWF